MGQPLFAMEAMNVGASLEIRRFPRTDKELTIL
jgi:hypothetical protein